MTTTTEINKTKVSSRKVLSDKPVNSRTAPEKTTQEEDEAGLGVLLNSNLPRSFKSVAEVDAHIRWLRE